MTIDEEIEVEVEVGEPTEEELVDEIDELGELGIDGVMAEEQDWAEVRDETLAELEAGGGLPAEADVAFFLSYVILSHDGRLAHGIRRVRAANHSEAIGRAYLALAEDYPLSDGWVPPSLLIDASGVVVLGDGAPALDIDEDIEGEEPTPGAAPYQEGDATPTAVRLFRGLSMDG